MSEFFVIKLGGSVLSKSLDNLFDFTEMAKFRQTLQPAITKGDKFFVITGGGFLCRNFQSLARQNGIVDDVQLHWIGLTANVMNAQLAKASCADLADDEILAFGQINSTEPLTIEKSLKFVGAARPGHSGDMDALVIAERSGAKTIFSLKNIDGVYSADPKKDPAAHLIEKLTWDEYLNVIGNPDEHEPGGNYPIDPVTARQAKDDQVKFVVLLGTDFANFAKALAGEEFHGSVVGPE